VFAAVAVLSLALGIGANTAIFSIVDAILLKNLPVANPEQLRVLTWTRERDDAPDFEHSGYNMTDAETGEHVSGSFSYRGYELFRDRVPALSNAVAFAWNQFTVTVSGKSDYANGEFVSGNYFTGLGVRAILGRTILPGDDSLARPAVAVLTYRAWLKRFHADPGVIGSNIFVNQRPVIIVGVLQPRFEGVTAAQSPELFLPFSTVPSMSVPWYSLKKPNYWWIQIFARLKPGVSNRAAEAALNAAMQNLVRETGSPAANGKAPRVFVRPGAKGVNLAREGLFKPILILGSVVILVLIMSCANVAHLLLARGIARAKEIGIRFSMGASRQRIIRQFVTESLLLGIAGASIGLILAQPLMNLVLRLLAGEYALAASVSLDLRTLVFTLGIAVFTALLFGIMPAWQSARVGIIESLKSDAGSQRTATSGIGLGRLLVSLQVAVSLTLLIGAGLFVRTLLNLSAVDLGFQTDHLLVFQTDGSRQGYHGERLAQLYSRINEKLATIPGVKAVAASQQALIQGNESDDWVVLSPPSLKKSRNAQSQLLFCSSSFLSTLGIPILRGRNLLPSDAIKAPKVAIVNKSFVQQYLPHDSALGEIFYFGDDAKHEPIEIVGIAGDAHYTSVRRTVQPTIYLPMEQHLASFSQAAFFIRTAIPPLMLAKCCSEFRWANKSHAPRR